MKNTELEHEVNEFREKVARVSDAGNAERLFNEGGDILKKFILGKEVNTLLYEEFADLRYIVYNKKKRAASGRKAGS
ncbi:MAG: hypothetical protein HZB82_02925 [Deltaproteobacteria bacterium]|nr:hypothetical protein [Deltaproteobacteria bacterium]